MSIASADIARLRAQTGAGMMDCKNALEEAGGDNAKAIDLLRQRGIAKAAKRADKVAAEGLVASYIHGAGKIGVLVEVNCETDFVAKTEGFRAFVYDIALHVAAMKPLYVSRADVLDEVLRAEKAIYRGQLELEGKPEAMLDRIVEGKLEKFYTDTCLLDQPFIKDEDKTIAQLLTQKTVEIGEKISVRRFARFELGEGMEKVKTDFVAEVEAQLQK